LVYVRQLVTSSLSAGTCGLDAFALRSVAQGSEGLEKAVFGLATPSARADNRSMRGPGDGPYFFLPNSGRTGTSGSGPGPVKAYHGGRGENPGRDARPREEQGDRHPGRAAVAPAGADPGDHLRAQAGPGADLAAAGVGLGDDQAV